MKTKDFASRKTCFYDQLMGFITARVAVTRKCYCVRIQCKIKKFLQTLITYIKYYLEITLNTVKTNYIARNKYTTQSNRTCMICQMKMTDFDRSDSGVASLSAT